MTDQQTRPAHRRRRTAACGMAVVIGTVLGGCTSTVIGVPMSSRSVAAPSGSDTRPQLTTGSSRATTDFDLELTIVPADGDATGTQQSGPPATSRSDADLLPAVMLVLGGVDGLSEAAQQADTYVGTLDGLTKVSMTLPGATGAQLAAARRALDGTWTFGLRVVISGMVDAAGCAELLDSPVVDRVCDPASREVLVLGTALPVRPSSSSYALQGSLPTVMVAFDRDAQDVIADYTAAHVGERLAITDGRGLITAPTIQAAITAGAIQISGGYTPAQARALTGKLQLATADVRISSSP